MIVVSNTSPITNLAAIDRLDLLEILYGHVLIPEAVMAELGATGSDGGDFALIRELPWIMTREVSNRPLVSSLLLELDIGEAEAIALAIEEKADLLLIDERRGRNTATRLSLRVLGLLGILIDAKQKGFIDKVRPIFDALISTAGFWIGGPLYSIVIETAGEI